MRLRLREIADGAKTAAAEALSADDFESARSAIGEAQAAKAVQTRFEVAFGDSLPVPPPTPPEPLAVQPDPEPSPPVAPPASEPPPDPVPGDPPADVPPIVEPPAPKVSEPAPVVEPPARSASNGSASNGSATNGASSNGAAATKARPAPKPKPEEPPAHDRAGLAARLGAATRRELKPPADGPETLERRGLVLAARGFLASAREEERDLYREEVEILRRSNDEPFYGYNNARHWPATLWFELAEAYLAVVAFERLRAAELGAFVNSARNEAEAAAVAALVYAEGIFRTSELPASDGDLRKILDRLAADHKGLVSMYRPTADDPVKRSQLVRMARRIYDLDEKIRREEARAKEIAQAREELKTILEGGEEWETRLPAAAQRLLDIGVPATDGWQNSALVGYEAALADAPGPKMARLRESLAKYGRGRKVDVLEPPAVGDAEYEAKRAEVREFTRGKALGLVGGNKGQRERRAEIVAELELSELLWPDVEETTAVASIYPQVRRADLVGLIVRFSRHSYQEVIKDAQKEGRLTFHITAGLNPRAIVNNLHAQLPRG